MFTRTAKGPWSARVMSPMIARLDRVARSARVAGMQAREGS